MKGQTFINLAVKDLDKTVHFFTELGFKFEPKFTDENATCMIIGKDSFAMLLTEKFFKSFIPKTEISDPHQYTESMVAISLDSKDEVDEMVEKALDAGAMRYKKPEVYEDWMYSDGFQDLDGHIWDFFYMDEAKAVKAV